MSYSDDSEDLFDRDNDPLFDNELQKAEDRIAILESELEACQDLLGDLLPVLRANGEPDSKARARLVRRILNRLEK